MDQEPEKFCETQEQYINFCRNRTLIDFDYVPEDIETKIMEEYGSLNSNEKKIPLEYFQKHQLNDLMGEFFFGSSSPFKK